MGRRRITIPSREIEKRADWVLDNRDWINGPEDLTEEDYEAMKKGLTIAEISYILDISDRSLRGWQKLGRLPRGTRGYIPVGDIVAALAAPEEE
jgi:hypothetical protein